jgi:transposase
MQSITTIGLDIAKSVFQVHGVDAAGQVVLRRQLRRRHVLAFFQKLPPCMVGIAACASSHHWSRELQALGHTVRLMPPAYVKPYVKRQKNDTTDAEAICEAVTRPNMRFVPTRTVEQQSCLMLHRARHLFIRQQTAITNSIRAYLAEFGIVAAVGRRGVEQLLEVVADPADRRLPEVARTCVAALGSQLRALKAQTLEFDRRIIAWHRFAEGIMASGHEYRAKRPNTWLLRPLLQSEDSSCQPGAVHTWPIATEIHVRWHVGDWGKSRPVVLASSFVEIDPIRKYTSGPI